MKIVDLADAQATFAALINRVERGETFTLTRNNQPVAELGPVMLTPRKGLRPWGLAKREFTMPDDFNDPLPDDLLDLFEGKADDK